MQIVPIGYYSHEMSNPVSEKKKIQMSSAEIISQYVEC